MKNIFKIKTRKENHMKTNKKYIQNQNSLRLMLLFNKFENIKEVILAYNVLSLKGSKKSVYLIDVMNYYFQNYEKSNKELRTVLFEINLFKTIKSYYNIETRDDVIKLFDNKNKYTEAQKNRFNFVKPTIVTLGFNKRDPEAQRIHETLFKMKVNERLLTIANAIKFYVETGNDPAAEMKLMFNMVADSISEYKKTGDETIIDKWCQLMEI